MASSGTADRPVRGRAVARFGLGAVVLAVAGVAAGNAGRVRTLRRDAAARAGDLDHDATVGEGVGAPLRLVIAGDSAARGFGLEDPRQALAHQAAIRLAAATGRRVAVSSLATDGHRTRDVIETQLLALRAQRPDAIVLGVGVNDVIKATGTRTFTADTRALFTALTSGELGTSGVRVAVVACPDLAAAPGFPAPLDHLIGWRGRRLARIQRRVATEVGLTVAELGTPSAEHFGPDGFHPGPVAHREMAAAAVAALVPD
jgi:lysophospholipase L1-like esterase